MAREIQDGNRGRQKTVYDIFIASPGDVHHRKLASHVANAWNARNATASNVMFNPVMWETHVLPEMGAEPQALVNRVADRTHSVIAIFSARIGTATLAAESGTVEEVRRAVTQHRKVAVYFSSGSIKLKDLDVKQWEGVLAFKDECKRLGIYGHYSSRSDLETQLRDRIDGWGNDLTRATKDTPPPLLPVGELQGQVYMMIWPASLSRPLMPYLPTTTRVSRW